MNLVSRPEDSFSVVFNCSKCADTGIIFASNTQEWVSSPYAFRCDCVFGKSKSMPEMPLHLKWVPEHTDKRPSAAWFHEKFQSGQNLKLDSEFQRRQQTWGREFFEHMFREWKKGQGDLK
jgi:hypothetical protein